MFTFKLLTIFSLFILTLCKAVVDDSTFLHAALDSSPSSELDGNLITEFSTTLGLLGNNDPLGEALDLQLGQILADVDQDSHCSADSPEQVHPQPAYEEGSRRKREESSSCSKRQFYEQRGTTSLQKPTDGGQPRGQAGAESTQPGSNQNTDEKNIHDFEAPTDSQFGIPNTRICGDSDMNIPMCHPHDATDPVGIYLFPCRALPFGAACAYLETTWCCEITHVSSQEMLEDPWYFSSYGYRYPLSGSHCRLLTG